MIKTATRILASFAVLAASAFPAGAQITVLPAAEALRASESAFVLQPGVVADPLAGVIYLMNPTGGIDKLSVASGELLWSTRDAAKPLALYGDLLVAQVESTAGDLEIAMLDALPGGNSRLVIPIGLPPTAYAAVDEGMGRSFSARALLRDGELSVAWEQNRRHIKGIAPRPDQTVARSRPDAYRLGPGTGGAEPEPNDALETQFAAYRIDPLAGVAEPLADDIVSEPAHTLPPNVQAWVAAAPNRSAVSLADSVLAATETFGAPGPARIVLHRWDADTGQAFADVELFKGDHLLLFLSADGRHLLVAERSAPGAFAEYQWSLFFLTTGELVGQVTHHQSYARFFVAGDTLVYESRPYARRIDDEWVSETLKLRAVSLSSGAAVWEWPLRDTAFRGAFPP